MVKGDETRKCINFERLAEEMLDHIDGDDTDRDSILRSRVEKRWEIKILPGEKMRGVNNKLEV